MLILHLVYRIFIILLWRPYDTIWANSGSYLEIVPDSNFKKILAYTAIIVMEVKYKGTEALEETWFNPEEKI